MESFIKRQSLNPDQYRRANRTMCLILAICYLVYIIVEVINIGKFGMSNGLIIRCVFYGIMLLTSVIAYRVLATRKSCMIVFAVTFLIAYGVLIFNNGVVVITMVFPALIGFMIYLDSALVGIGCIGTLAICVVKCVMLRAAVEYRG